jgi:hypothetical protein
MSTWTERKVVRALSERDPIEPPEGLLDKLKSEIPADVGSRLPATALREAQSAQVVTMPDRRLPRHQLRLLAASLILMLGGGLFALFVMRSSPSMSEVAEEKAAGSTAPSVAAGPEPQRMEAAPRQTEPPREAPQAAEKGRVEELRALGYAGSQDREEAPKKEVAPPSFSAAAPAPAPPPPAEPQADLAEEVESGVEGRVAGGVSGGVVGGAPGGVVNQAARMDVPRQVSGANESDMARDRLSTFGLDVDTTSYTVARGYLLGGQLPPREAIRVEEFVNHFSYGDPPPAQGDFALRAEGAASIFTQEPRTYLLRFNLRAREAGTPQIIAEDARVQVEFSSAAVARWRLIGYESGGTPGVGEIGAGRNITAIYEVQLTPQAAGKIAVLHLRYRVPATGKLRESVRNLRASELVPDWKNASAGFRLASLVAEFAETLRGSSQAEDYRKILRLAEPLVDEMSGQPRAADVAEFVRLVETAARLREKK